MKNITRILTLLIFPILTNAATVTNVGVLPSLVGYTPTSSQCADINESGQAACLSKAFGVPYKCGFRLAKTCQRVHNTIFRFDNGQATIVATGIDSGYGSPTNFVNGINNLGDIAWGGTTFISDYGKVVETHTVVGGSKSVWNNKVYTLDGTPILFPGIPSTANDTMTSPNAISNTGELAGMQWAESRSTINGVLGKGGTGLFVQQADLDFLASLGDDPAPKMWAYGAASYGWNSVRSYVYDINDNGDTIVGLSGYPWQVAMSNSICKRDFTCTSHEGTLGSFAAIVRFSGINNIGDAVGVVYPRPYSGTNSAYLLAAYTETGKPTAWIDGVTVNLNDAIAGSGYTVTAVGDINDARQIAGTCINNGVKRGCLINL